MNISRVVGHHAGRELKRQHYYIPEFILTQSAGVLFVDQDKENYWLSCSSRYCRYQNRLVDWSDIAVVVEFFGPVQCRPDDLGLPGANPRYCLQDVNSNFKISFACSLTVRNGGLGQVDMNCAHDKSPFELSALGLVCRASVTSTRKIDPEYHRRAESCWTSREDTKKGGKEKRGLNACLSCRPRFSESQSMEPDARGWARWWRRQASEFAPDCTSSG